MYYKKNYITSLFLPKFHTLSLTSHDTGIPPEGFPQTNLPQHLLRQSDIYLRSGQSLK